MIFIFRFDLPAGPQGESSRLTFVSLAFGLLLLALHRFDTGLSQWKAVQAFSRIGLFSYSLYLVHTLVIGLINQIVHLVKAPDLHFVWFSVRSPPGAFFIIFAAHFLSFLQ